MWIVKRPRPFILHLIFSALAFQAAASESFGPKTHDVIVASELELLPEFAARLMPYFDFSTPEVRQRLARFLGDINGGMWFSDGSISSFEESERPMMRRKLQEARIFQAELASALAKTLERDLSAIGWKSWPISKQLKQVDLNSLPNVTLARIFYFLIEPRQSVSAHSKRLKAFGNTLATGPFRLRDGLPISIASTLNRVAFSRDGLGVIEFRTLNPTTDGQQMQSDLLTLIDLAGVRRYVMTTESKIVSGQAGFQVPAWGTVHIHASSTDEKPYQFFDALNAFLFSVRLSDQDLRDLKNQNFGLKEVDSRGLIRRRGPRRVEFRWQHLPLTQFIPWVLDVVGSSSEKVISTLEASTRENLQSLAVHSNLQAEILYRLRLFSVRQRNATALRYLIEYLPVRPDEEVSDFEQNLASLGITEQKDFLQMLVQEIKPSGLSVEHPKLLERARLWTWDASMLNAVSQSLSRSDRQILATALEPSPNPSPKLSVRAILGRLRPVFSKGSQDPENLRPPGQQLFANSNHSRHPLVTQFLREERVLWGKTIWSLRQRCRELLR